MRKITEIEIIKEVVCGCYQLAIKDLDNTTRLTEIREPRQIAHAITKEILKDKIPLQIIAYHIGKKKSHATVLNSIKVVSDMIETDIDFKETYESILKVCKDKILNETSKHLCRNGNVTLFNELQNTLKHTSTKKIKEHINEILIKFF